MERSHIKTILLAISLYLGVIFIQRFGTWLATLFTSDNIIQELAENAAGLLFVVAALTALKMWQDIYWWSSAALKKWYLFLLPAAYVFINAGEIYAHSTQHIVITAVSTTFTGIMEELLCRGLVLALFIKTYKQLGHKNYLLNAVLVSSLLFGIAHLTNAIASPHAAGAVFGQVFYATFIAVGFCAVYLHTRSILPLIVIHMLINFVSFLTDAPDSVKTATFVESIPAMIVCLPLMIFGVLLMNKKQQLKLQLSES